MKTLKSILLGLTLVVATTIANASTPPAALLSKNDVLNIYVNAVVHGKVDGVESVLAKDVKYVIYRNEKEFDLNKAQIIETLKGSENVDQNCTYTTSIMDESDKKMVVKLTLRYDGYIRNTMITIAMNKGDFQITKIESES
ncbi:hypothetical protein [Mucilaginibacter sp. dw_454]|uniref:hypothetical protein n=1 Tax=Mucilaginibacter sp. dw_454 TaxID=2720079 RepID=UPI001BD5B8D5|nr:hypothetical protein [Mucilaginibacter sp. dw_454]